MKSVKMTCAACGARDYSIYITGCKDCGEERVAAAERLGQRPNTLEPGHDFTPNARCRACCPTGHGTR